MVSESTLTLDILPLSADTARLVRVYGTEPVSYTHLYNSQTQGSGDFDKQGGEQ